MIFDTRITSVNEGKGETDDIDLVVKDVDTEEGQEAIANEVEANIAQASLESVTFFEGGEEAIKEMAKEYEEIAEAASVSNDANTINEARMAKKTLVIMGKDDDLNRRTKMACLVIAREKKDPLFKALAKNRVNERKIRNKIYRKYQNQARTIAKKSQKIHIKQMQKQKMKMPKIVY